MISPGMIELRKESSPGAAGPVYKGHAHFPKYSREEFIEVCTGFLTRAESCPPDLASLIGQLVYDYGIGDVRKARGAWQLMTAPTQDEALRVIQLMLKYSKDSSDKRQRASQTNRLL